MARVLPGRRGGQARGDGGLTTRGRCMVAGGCAAILCGVLLDERDLLRVGILAVALPLVALMLTVVRPAPVQASHRATPGRLRPGVGGAVELALSNVGGLRTRPMIVTDAATEGLTAGVRCLVPPLRRGATAVVRYPLMATRRGRFVIGSVTVRVTDPFGLCSTQRMVPSETEVLVLPTVVPLASMPSALGSRSAAAGAEVAGTTGGEPDVRVRPYSPGDDIRTIHWRASARRDDLVVRTREPVSHGGACVLVDHRAGTHRGSGLDSSLETAVTLAASVSVHLLAQDYQITLLGHTGAVIAAGNDVIDDVLVGLAVLEPDADGRMLTDIPPTTGLAVAILGGIDAADAHRLVAARPRSCRGVAVLVDTAGWEHRRAPGYGGDPVTGAEASAAILRAGGWRAVVAHRGEDLGAVWRGASRRSDYVGQQVS